MKELKVTKTAKVMIRLKGSGSNHNKKGFPETMGHKIFESNSSFCLG